MYKRIVFLRPLASDFDVPDDLCYQWAKEYFWDMDAEEDKEDEEKFVPKPYTGKPAPKPKKKAEKKKPESKVQVSPKDTEGQMDLFSLTGGAA